VLKQAHAVARRRNQTKERRYEQAKREYLMRRPHATQREYEDFIRDLTKRLCL
jgi:t-SNARE complex subunit (syntaxin)